MKKQAPQTSHSLTRLLAAALAATVSLGAFTACAPLMVGAAAGSAMVVTDRRTSGTQLEDEGIELRAISRLRESVNDRAHINITSYNRQVLLTGEVPTEAAKQQAEQVVRRVENVRSTVNEIAVMPVSSLGNRSNDALITGKVKAGLVDAKDLSALAFKVVTERGAVYLMGVVTQREADRATQIARSVNGVSRVVRVFEIVSEEELTRLLPPPPSPKKDSK